MNTPRRALRPTWILPAVCLALAAAALAQDPRHPHIWLENATLRALVYLPDETAGYYRGPRFERSGIVAEVQTGGRRFFGPWKPKHDPLNHDDIAGLAEEFDIKGPSTFAAARPGETFVKIGVGVLRRGDDKPYSFVTRYPLVDPGRWTIEHDRASVRFIQTLDGGDTSYLYEKIVRLDGDSPVITVERTLTNTGRAEIVTEHYGHHFVRIDDVPVGPAYAVAFGFDATPGEPARLQDAARVELGQFTWLADMPPKPIHFETARPVDAPWWVRLSVAERQAGLTIEGDRALSRFAVFAVGSAFCPEPFVQIRLAPGESTTWSNVYRFETPPQ